MLYLFVMHINVASAQHDSESSKVLFGACDKLTGE